MVIKQIFVNMKPMSVNDAWKGERYKTDRYKAYETEMLLKLPAGQLPPPPYKVYYEFGFSNHAADYDNPIKPTQDILSKKYGFNDKEIYEARIRKVIVKRGREYVYVDIEHMDIQPTQNK